MGNGSCVSVQLLSEIGKEQFYVKQGFKIVSLAMNGVDDVSNLQCTCKVCNLFKGSVLPDDFMERITEIFLYQMDKKQSKRLLWKIVHKLLNKMV